MLYQKEHLRSDLLINKTGSATPLLSIGFAQNGNIYKTLDVYRGSDYLEVMHSTSFRKTLREGEHLYESLLAFESILCIWH